VTGGGSAATRPEAAAAEERSEATFLDSIEFLTGEDPDLGSFLLVVGIVTAVFIALFQFALPPPVSHLLTAGVVLVTVLSAVVGAVLDGLGHFDRTAPATPAPERRGAAARPWVPAGGASAPLPPLINFDAELRAFAELFDGDLPPAFDPFVADYLRLKTSTRNRTTIASDLRAALNPVGALFDPGTEGDRLYEEVSDRLFRYIGDRGGHVTLDRVSFSDADGAEADVAALGGRLARVELELTNEGEAARVDAVVTLYDGEGAAVASRTCPAGVLNPGVRRVLDAEVYVPADVARAATTLRIADPGTDRPGRASRRRTRRRRAAEPER
jgi:hypothetical protein